MKKSKHEANLRNVELSVGNNIFRIIGFVEDKLDGVNNLQSIITLMRR